jgi:hypothetical protein
VQQLAAQMAWRRAVQTAGRAKLVRLTPASLMAELRKYEQQYGMSSQVFYDRFRAGELGDALDFVDWAGLCYMAVRARLLSAQPQSR